MRLLKSELLHHLARPLAPAFGAIALFSLVNTLLVLVPSIYMLQLSERVMVSRNETTLLFLTAIAVFLLGIMSMLDSIRYRILRRVAVDLDDQISGKVFETLNRGSRHLAMSVKGLVLADINTFREFVGGPTINNMMDLVWVPVTVAVMFIIHPMIGLTLLLILIATATLTGVNQRIVFGHSKAGQVASARANELARAIIRNAEAVRAMGMLPSLRDRWHQDHRGAIGWQSLAQTRAELTSGSLYFLRNAQPVLLMVVGTTLYLMHQVSTGLVFSIVFIGIRALAPVMAVAASWRALVNFTNAVERLEAVLKDAPDETAHVALPRPSGALAVSRVTLTADGTDKIVLSDISFRLASGRVLGVVGPSGAGKSSLAKLLVGAWRPRRGNVLLSGHDITHWNPDELGQYVGYVPQEIEFLAGTVAQNISRFRGRKPGENDDLLDAAEVAAIDDIIQTLPHGFSTQIGADGYTFSGGQRQRIALARAVYGNPSLMVLDEPNSNLDSVGEEGLLRTINLMRDRGCTIIIITHRLNMLNVCDDVMVLNSGTIHTIGSRDQIVARLSALKPTRPTALDLIASR